MGCFHGSRPSAGAHQDAISSEPTRQDGYIPVNRNIACHLVVTHDGRNFAFPYEFVYTMRNRIVMEGLHHSHVRVFWRVAALPG